MKREMTRHKTVEETLNHLNHLNHTEIGLSQHIIYEIVEMAYGVQRCDSERVYMMGDFFGLKIDGEPDLLIRYDKITRRYTVTLNQSSSLDRFSCEAFVRELAERSCETSTGDRNCIDDGRIPFGMYGFNSACVPCMAKKVVERNTENETSRRNQINQR